MDYADLLIKLGLSAILGFAIGLERELKRKPLGLKTCLVISIISCLLTIVSIKAAYNLPHSSRITMDPLRLAAQIVSGIGFLGAGVILRRGNDSIAGLTTAAMIWGASGIGIAVGAGFYLEAIFGMCFLMISVELIPLTMKFLGPKSFRQREIAVKLVVSRMDKIPIVIDEIKEMDIKVKNIKLKALENGSHFLQLKLSVDQKKHTADVYYAIQRLESVQQTEVESI
ncbi:MgtC/SapB family protein [Bacillus sp. DX1.1]|uniref:MgtC/SapB family protein n=1 Tax=unclassified Bacillus (in: firmicutes) TaxID=185979 RepID=UPI0025705463|nr:MULTISPECIES: MgtC/SapB family protein [unclassified Bacillus (in: firmicutes)]MDM5157013.1 MgtC/SapB family protein [Bacillus sp. DX1.1]WJE81251.1 MgtC/SapB family protein [Bacillus sp. DX3.1]